MRLILLALVCIAFVSCNSTKKTTSTEVEPSTTVESRSTRPNNPRAPGGGMREARQEMLAALNLTDEQRPQFDAIVKKYRDELQALRQSNSGDRRSMMMQARELMDKQKEELKTVLTDEQMKTYEEHFAQMRQGMRGGRPGGGK